MAADPIAAAQALAGQTYSDAQARTEQSKQALLNQLGTQGTYTNQLNAGSAAAAAPTPAPMRPGDSPQLTAMSSQGAQQVQLANQAALGAAAALAAHQQAQAQQAAGTYFDQVKAAVPIEQSRAASDAANVLANLQAQRDAHAAAAQQAAIQLEISKNDLAKSKLSTSQAGTLNPLQQFTLQAEMDKTAADAALPQNKYASPVLDPASGKIIGYQPNPTGQAIKDVIAGKSAYQAALDNGLDSSAVNEIARQAQVYYDTMDRQGFYTATGRPKPTVNSAMPAPALAQAVGANLSGRLPGFG